MRGGCVEGREGVVMGEGLWRRKGSVCVKGGVGVVMSVGYGDVRVGCG